MNRILLSSFKLCGIRQIPSTISNITRKLCPQKAHQSKPFSSVNLDASSAVIKDTVLFKFENPKLFRAINFFALAQFFFWNWLSYFSLNNLKDVPVQKENTEDLPFWRRINLGENKYRNTIAVTCFLMGYGILTMCWMFTLKSVRLLVLRQGGQSVSFISYTPFGKSRIMDVPIKFVSAQESRQTARVTMPVKIKGHKLYYVLDMRGEFKNPQLFDQTVGLRRNFAK